MKKLNKILLLIFICSFVVTCTKNERTLNFKSKVFKNLLGRWELQTVFVNGIDSTIQIMADSTLSDEWSFNFSVIDKNKEGKYFTCYYRGRKITSFCQNCWYLSNKESELIILFVFEKNKYERLWQQNNKEVIFDIIFINEYLMILKVKDLNNNVYQLNFIKRSD